MKAMVCEAFGDSPTLVLREVPSLEPGPRQAVVRVHAAGVNFPDALIVQGKYQFKPELPFAPGFEFAGTVLRVGTGVTHLQPGDKVAGTSPYGAYAQEIAVDAQNVIPLPVDLDAATMEQAGSLIITYGTTLHALKDRAQAKPGETLLVLGAGGGVGLAAVELGCLLGLRVIAGASSTEKLEAARQYGAQETVDYTRENLRERIKSITNGRGVDIVYDPVGGALGEPAVRSLGWGGRYLVVGFAAGEIPKIPLNLLLLKGSALVGVFWGEFARRQPADNAANIQKLFGWLREGRIHPPITARYPLAQASAALEALLQRRAIGKMIILPQEIG